MPPRDYRLLAELLTSAASADDSGRVRDALLSAAEEEGKRGGAPERPLEAELKRRGYEPSSGDGTQTTLRNCPFHQLAQRHTDLVCGINYALLRGVLMAHSDDANRARLEPQEGRCCVVLAGTL